MHGWKVCHLYWKMISAKTGKNSVEPRNTISTATSQWIAMWQQIALKLLKNYAKHMGLQGVWRKEDENEQEMVPSFAETYEALEEVKAFFYAQSVSDADRENIVSLEKSYFQLRQNSAKKQKTMYDFFCLKKVVSRINHFPAFIVCFLHPLEKRYIEVLLYCISE